MNRRAFFYASALAGLSCVAVLIAFPAPQRAAAADGAEKNLVANGSLEDAVAGAGLPEGWYAFMLPEGAYKAGVVEGGRTGGKSLLVEGDGTYGGVTTTRLTIIAGSRYIARGWLKVEGNDETAATIKLDYFNDQGEWLTSTNVGEVKPQGQAWRSVALTDRAGQVEDAATIAVSVVLLGKGKVWFDDLEMYRRTPADGPKNLLSEGSFEEHAAGKVSGWWLGMSDDGKVELSIGDDKPKDGWTCLHMKGNAEWAVATGEHLAFDKKKTYTLTGFARAKSGAAAIKIDYFDGDQYIGHTVSEEVNDDNWHELTVTAEPNGYPGATHIAASAIGMGEIDACYDKLVLTAK